MRDIIVTLLVLIGLFYTVKKPHIGVLVWSWLGYMNPHRLCWGFAYNLPFSQIIALFTMITLLFSTERKSLPKDALVYLLVLFVAWTGMTTFFAFRELTAEEQYVKFIKIMLPIFLTLMMFNTKERIHQLLWVIVLSLGFFSIKGGVFTLITAGSFRVYGPPESFVEENNSLAVATLMIMPLMVYLRNQVSQKLYKNILLLCLISMGFSVIGSQSRGAFVAILIVGIYYWLQSRHKFSSAIMILFFVGVLALLLPDSWYERMSTINTYDQDDSAMGRIRAWVLAFNVANHNVFGGGFNMWDKGTYIDYLENFDPRRKAYVAHSIYFSVLGEHGWFGLMIYLLSFFMGWKKCTQLVKQCNQQMDVQWIAELARMMKVGLIAYFAGGAFLSLSYFDLPWHFLAIIVLLKEVADKSETQDTDMEFDEREHPVTVNPYGLIK